MSTRTTYYNLTKPDADEHVLRSVINQNYDAIDLQMHANAEAAKDAAKSLAAPYDENTSYTAGDFCINQNKLMKANTSTTGPFNPADWDETTIEAEFERRHVWQLFETYNVETASQSIRRTLPAGINGVFVSIKVGAGSGNAEFGIVIKTTGRHSVGDLGSFITTSVGYGTAEYTRDGNLWSGYITQRGSAAQASPNMTARGDGFALDAADAEYIEFRTNTSGAVVPVGSQFVIYTRS